MSFAPEPLDLRRIQVYPLAQRNSLSQIGDILLEPDSPPPLLPGETLKSVHDCAKKILAARERNASVMLIYGAHLIKNGGAKILIELMELDWLTHLATNGAGIIHDWELSFLGRTEESVKQNVATGNFGTWHETGRNIHLALLAGGLDGDGFGCSLGKFISENGVTLPTLEQLEAAIKSEPADPLTAARADLHHAMRAHLIASGHHEVKHPWKNYSVVGQAYEKNVPFTVHPGVGYDIISNHPMFNGAAIGRAAEMDFRIFGGAVEKLDGGVVLSVGSAIMGPQVFEKSLSCVNNLRLQNHRPIVHDHNICVVDLQEGGNWDWSKGEPPKTNPAYYLRFCKSYSRMGGAMNYLQCDNVAFIHQLLHELKSE